MTLSLYQRDKLLRGTGGIGVDSNQQILLENDLVEFIIDDQFGAYCRKDKGVIVGVEISFQVNVKLRTKNETITCPDYHLRKIK